MLSDTDSEIEEVLLLSALIKDGEKQESDLRRRVSYGQLEQLWEFLNQRREVALGYNKSSQARHYHRQMWEEVAQSLNSHGEGSTKDWKGWCKYWNDYKSKLKKIAAAARTSHSGTGGGPSTAKPLTEIELKFIQLFGADFGCGLDGVRVEPFEEEIQPEQLAEISNDSIFPEPSLELELVIPSSSISRTARLSPYVQSPLRRSPRRQPPPPQFQSTPVPDTINRPRRRARRAPPVSASDARRALIEETKQQTKLEMEKVELLRTLVSEIRELKETILIRFL